MHPPMLRRRLRSRPPGPRTGVGASTPPPGIPAHTGPHPPRHHSHAPRRRTSRPRVRHRGRGRAGQGAPMRCVMKCHVLSCFVMAPYARGSYPVAGPGMMLSFRTGLPGSPPGSSATPSSASAFPSALVSFRSSRRPVPPSGGTLFRAYRMGARARVCAGAVRAPDCARTRVANAGRMSPVRSVGFFSRRREAGHGAARGCRYLLSHPTTDLQRSSRFGNYFLLYEQAAAGQKRRVKLSDLWAPLQSIRFVPEVRPLHRPRRAEAAFAAFCRVEFGAFLPGDAGDGHDDELGDLHAALDADGFARRRSSR